MLIEITGAILNLKDDAITDLECVYVVWNKLSSKLNAIENCKKISWQISKNHCINDDDDDAMWNGTPVQYELN